MVKLYASTSTSEQLRKHDSSAESETVIARAFLSIIRRGFEFLSVKTGCPQGGSWLYLSEFIITIRKKDNGDEYEPTSLRSMMASFERHLNVKSAKVQLVNLAT